MHINNQTIAISYSKQKEATMSRHHNHRHVQKVKEMLSSTKCHLEDWELFPYFYYTDIPAKLLAELLCLAVFKDDYQLAFSITNFTKKPLRKQSLTKLKDSCIQKLDLSGLDFLHIHFKITLSPYETDLVIKETLRKKQLPYGVMAWGGRHLSSSEVVNIWQILLERNKGREILFWIYNGLELDSKVLKDIFAHVEHYDLSSILNKVRLPR